MKTIQKNWRGFLLVITAVILAMLVNADNPCVETGPHYGGWLCNSAGSLKTPGTLSTTNINVQAGVPIIPPVLTVLPTLNNGQKERWVSYDCSPGQDSYQPAPVLYTVGPLYFVPSIPSSISVPGTNTYAAEVDATPTSLVGWWPGEGNANDLVFGNNGSLQNGVSFGYGMVGRAFNFNGTNSYVLITNSPNLSPSGPFTVEAWVNYDGLTGTNGISIVAKGRDADGPVDWSLNIGPAGKLRPQLMVSGGWHYFDCSTSLNPGAWYHVALVYDGSYLRGYVNGVQDGYSSVGGGQVAVSTNSFRIGAYAPVNGTASKCFFSGLIDEVSVYSCALSATQIQAIYNAGSAGKNWNGATNGAALPASCICSSVTGLTLGTVTVTVAGPPPVITNQPIGQAVVQGTNVTFGVGASGTLPLGYQWWFNGATVSGATNASLVLNSVLPANAGNYFVVVSNSGGSVTSATAMLTVNVPVSITTQPQPTNQTVVQGANATFSLTAAGTLPLGYQWYFNGTNLIAGATGNPYTELVVVPSEAGNYNAVVTNTVNGVTSSNASLTVIVPPIITTEPTNLTVNLTSNATFALTVSSSSTTPLGYQWSWNGNPLPGATNTSLTITNVQATNVGYYSAVVTNVAGASASAAASLTATMFSTGFFYPSAIKVNGNANFTNTTDGNVLEMNPAAGSQAASAFFLTPISLVSNASFSTFFSFRLSKSGGITNTASDSHVGADGIVFVVQTITNNVGSSGGGIGFWGITNSVGTVFDTWFNTGDPAWDPQLSNSQTILILTNANGTTGDGNHVGVVYNGYLTNAATFRYGIRTNGYNAVAQHVMEDMNDGTIWYAWVDYNGAISNLQVRLATNNIRPVLPTLTNTVNLLDFVGTTNAYLGFTSGTGGSWNQQDILSWQFISPYHPIGSGTVVPSVTITSPSNNAVFLYGPPIALQASAIEPGGTVTNVQFFSGTNLTVTNFLGNAVVGSNNTYDLAWTNSLHGTNTLIAAATDSLGSSTTSAVVYVVMDSPPSVGISPASQTIPWLEGSTSTNITLNGSVLDDGLPYRVTNILWSVISSNGLVTFANTHTAATSVTLVTNGTYVLQLEADDGFATNTATCTITVQRRPFITITSPTNGSIFSLGQTIFINATVYDLNGVVTNVQFFDGAVSLVAMSGESSAYEMIWTNAPDGVNPLSAVAWDNNGLITTSSVVTVTVNRAPIVSAGPNQIITLPATNVTLAGTVIDDGMPPGAPLTALWSVLSSNGPVTFGNVTVTNTTAYFANNGLYVLQLTANDTVSTNSATVMITVNQKPQVSAGAHQIVNLIGSNVMMNLAGSFSDDGLPVGTPVTPVWSVTSATNGNVVLGNTNLAAATATFTNDGNYTLQLTVNDTVSTNSSNVVITVNYPPVVGAGTNQTLVWPEGSNSIVTTLSGTATDDGYPFGTLTTTWSKVSGPGTVTFGNANTNNTTAAFSTNGIYVLQLTASDGYAATSNQCIITVERRPFVSIVSPTNNAAFAAGATITNIASTFDFDGVVTNVAFYNGTNFLGRGAPVIPVSGRVGFWRGEGDANDSAGTNRGVIVNAGFTNGVVGQAFANDPENYPHGTYNAVDLADSPAYVLTNQFSIEGWMRPRGNGYVVFWRGDNRPGMDPFTLSMQGNNTLSFVIDDNSNNSVAVSVALTYSNWYHVAATFNLGSLMLYTNGVLAVQTNTALVPIGNLIAADHPGVGIANENDGLNNFPFLGDVDEIALYNRALSASEVQSIYNAGTNYQFAYTWTNVPAGSNTLVAVATDNNGLMNTSAPVNITVSAVSGLAVSITQPSNNAVFPAPGVIPISATVVSNANTVNLVNFFADGIQIGQDALDSSNPHTFTWVGAPAGSHILTAQAVDVLGNTATSPGVTVYVASPVGVNAGANQVVILTNSSVTVTLSGSVSGGYGAVTSLWTEAIGPAAVQFANAALTNTAITFTNANGNYLLRLTAADGYSQAAGVVMFTVLSNQPPVVNAGPNRIIAPSNTVFLNGSVTDDGLPPPPSLTSWWSVISGPVTNGIVITNVSAPVTTAGNFTNLGVYTLQLNASDGLATNSSQMTVTVVDPSSRTYTYDADFAEGELVNVNFNDVPNQLQLNQKITPFPFVWVACSQRGTIVRIDVNNGQILGEYQTIPEGRAEASYQRGSASRTTVDKYGNVWVGNRCDNIYGTNAMGTNGSITRIGLVIGGTRGDKIYTNGATSGTNFIFVPDPNGEYLQPPFEYCTAVDRDGDGLIHTSRGLEDVLGWDTNMLGSNDLGGVSLADDECIINYTRVPPVYGVRTIAVDANNDVWIGGTPGNCDGGHHEHLKISGVTGQPIPNTTFTAAQGGYGGLIDGQGVLWTANSMTRFDIAKRFDMSVYPPAVIDPGYVGDEIVDNYGIGIDPNTGYVWGSVNQTGSAIRVAPDGSHYDVFTDPLGGTAGGIAVDNNSNVWVASHSSGNVIEHFRTDGTFVGNLDLGCPPGGGNHGPTGVSVDANGKIWATCMNSSLAMRIDPNRGPRMLTNDLSQGGYLLGGVDMIVNLDTGAAGETTAMPYNYSDMTGFVSLGATEPSGIWQVVHDSGIASEPWGIVQWDSSEPAGTGVKVEVRAADNYLQLDATNNLFVQISNNVPFSGLTGRYIEIRTSFWHKTGTNATPVLYDLTVSTGTNAVIANSANFANSDRVTMLENGAPLTINVLSNDVAPAGAQLSITSVSPASDGYVTIGAGATNLIYTSNTNFYGVDQFSYTASDGQGGIGRAVVTVEIGQVVPPFPTNYGPPMATSTNVEILGNSVANPNSEQNLIPVESVCSDTNNPPLDIIVQSVSPATHGFAQIDHCGVYYTPNPGYYGTDSFTYTIANTMGLTATAQINVTVTGGPPIPLSCGANINGIMTTNDSTAPIFSSAQCANIYTFAGEPNQAIAVGFTCDSGISMQIYGPAGPVSSPVVAQSSNTYYIEVTSSLYQLATSSNYNLTLSCSSTNVPYMSVLLGTNSTIPNGGGIDFGVTRVGWPVAAYLTITNYGTTNLDVQVPSFSPSDGTFVLTGSTLTNASIVIPGGSSSNLTVWFEALEPGQTNGTMTINANSDDYSWPVTYTINLTARANATNTVPPTVGLTNPVPNTVYVASQIWSSGISMTATSTPAAGANIWAVNYYAATTNGTQIPVAQDFSAQNGNAYTKSWVGALPGNYQLTAMAIDDSGLQTVSAPVPITVLLRDTSSPVMEVLFMGTNALGNDSTINFGVVPPNVPVQVLLVVTNLGPGTLTGGSVDFGSGTYSSGPFYVTNSLQSYSLAAGHGVSGVVVFTAGAYGTSTADLYVDGNDESLFGPYNDNQTVGRMTIHLTGTVADTGTPPTVVITNPAPNRVFYSPASINLQALAAGTTPDRLSVEFYATTTNGVIDIGSGSYNSATGYFEYAWTPVPLGQYTLTAKVINVDLDLAALSVPVAITVQARPATSPVLQVFLSQTNVVGNASTILYPPTASGNSSSATLTLSNSGNATLIVSNILINTSYGTDFRFVTVPAQPVTILAGKSTNVVVSYNPSSGYVGSDENGTLIITNGDVARNPLMISLFGHDNPATAAPRVVITNPVVNATFVASQTFNTPISLTATSTPPHIAGNSVGIYFYATDANGSNYQVGYNSSSTPQTGVSVNWYGVPPGAYKLTSVAYDYSYSPPPAGISTTVPINVQLRDSSSPNMQVLIGTNNNVANSSTLDFGIVPSNTAVSVVLTITNLGPGILTNTSLSIDGDDWGVFDLTGAQAGFVLAPHTATNMTLAFDSPWTLYNGAPFTAQFNFYGNDEGVYLGNQAGLYQLELTGVATNLGAPPTVVIAAPVSNTVFLISNTISITADASASGSWYDTMSRVDFYAASAGVNMYLGTVSGGSGVYSFNWLGAAPGQYTLTAVAVDSLGLTTISTPIPVTVLLRPTNSPVMQVFLAQTNLVPNDSTINDGITTVGTPVAASLTISNAGNAVLSISKLILSDTNDFSISNSFDLPLSIAAGTTTNLTLLFNAASPGQASGILTLYDSDVASQPFYITNSGNANAANGVAPTIYLTTPINGLQYTYPSDISLTAVAFSATNSSLANIAFYSVTPTGNVALGQVMASPGQTNLIGQATWSRPAPGTYTIDAIATDSSGLMGQSTNVVIQVVGTTNGLSTNAPPVARDDSIIVEGVVSNSVTYPINVLENDSSPNGYPLTLTSFIYDGKLGQVTQDGNRLLFTPYPLIEGTNYVYYTISDGYGGTAGAQVQIVVKMTPLPTIQLVYPDADGEDIALSTNLANRNLALVAYAQGSVRNFATNSIAKVTFYDQDQPIGYTTVGISNIFSYIWQTPPAGWHYLAAVCVDNIGQENITPYIQVYIEGNTNDTPPTATITNLQMTAQNLGGGTISQEYPLVTNGIISVLGLARATTAGDTTSYQILLEKPDGTVVANVTPNANPTNGYYSGTDQSGVLASNIDLSMYENGVYDLVLNVFDGWLVSSDSARILLNTQLKIGNFSFSVQDVSLPVSGMPLTVTRTYNSFNLNNGDFGYSWTYAISDVNLQLDEVRQNTPDVDDNTFSLRVGGGRDVTLTLPDGRTVTFQFYFDGPRGVGSDYYAAWSAPAGVNYTLTALGNPYYDGLTGFWDNTDGTSFDSFDFPGYDLTAPDGTQYIITREDDGEYFYASGDNGDFSDNSPYVHTYGAATLSEIIEPNGDTIQISGDEVDHYNSVGTLTRAIRLERDNQNRIIAVRDPNSATNGPAVMQYTYDPNNGNLVNAMKLTDATANGGAGAYDVTTYQYTNANFPHFMTGIIGPSGVAMAKNFYDSSGRLIAVQDANGNLTQFSNNPTNNMEVVIDRLGHTNTYVYDSRGNVIIETNALGAATFNTYDPSNHLTSTTDPLGYTTSYAYDAFGNQKQVVDPLNHTNFYNYDSAGRLLSQTNPLGTVTENLYDNDGNLTNTIQLDAQNNIISGSSYIYQNGELIQTANLSNQITSSFGYDSAGNLTSSTDVNNFTHYFGYDSNGNQTNSYYVWTAPDNSQVTVSTATIYDSAGRGAMAIDADGNTNRTIYNSLGQVAYTVDKFGNTNSSISDARGNVIQNTQADGTFTRTVYDSAGNPILTSDRNQVTGTFTQYDAAGRVTNTVRMMNLVISIVADPANPGQLISTNVSLGTGYSTNSTVYLANGWVSSRTGPDGETTTYTYWPDGQIKTMVDPLNHTNYYQYDAAGHQALIQDALNHTNQFHYDAAGRLVATVFADNSMVSNVFNSLGQHTSAVDQIGLTTQFGYDVSGQLTNVIKPTVPDPQNGNTLTNPAWTYQYDKYGHLVTSTDPRGRTNTFTYDARGRQITHRLPMGQVETNVYYTNYINGNIPGELWKQYDFKGQRTEFVYDHLGRVKARYLFQAGATTPDEAVCYIYNSLGQLAETVERYGADATTNACDGYARLVGLPRNDSGLGAKLVASLSRNPNVASGTTVLLLLAMSVVMIPARQRRQLLELALEIYDEQVEVFQALLGRVAVTRGSRRWLRLPSLGWRLATLIALAALIGNEPWVDQLWTAHGQCVYPSNASTPTTRYTYFTYDLDGHLVQVNTPEGVINYGYDLATGRQTLTCTANSEVSYGYDALGRLQTVTVLKRNGVMLTTAEVTTYGYDALGNRSTVSLPNGVVTTYLYDNLNRMTNLVHQLGTTNLAMYSYKLNAAGRRTNAVEVLRQEDNTYQTNTLNWAYDQLYRLTNEVNVCKSPDGNYAYTNAYQYDLVGNRWQQIKISASTTVITNAYDANDELLQEVTKVNGTLTDTNNYAYDLNGSVTGKTNSTGTLNYTYDAANKLNAVLANGILQASYLYNEQGVRVQATSGATVHYLIDANNQTSYAQVLEELGAVGGTPSMSYVIGTEVLAQCGTTVTTPTYFLPDGHGNNRQLTTLGGAVAERYDYDAYGVVQANTSSTTAEAAPTSKLYSGEQYDSNLHMYNLRARYYDPSNGRFNQQDSFAGNNDDPQTLHKYLYCQDNPINETDPSGYDPDMISVMCAVAIGAGLSVLHALPIVGLSLYAGGAPDAVGFGIYGDLSPKIAHGFGLFFGVEFDLDPRSAQCSVDVFGGGSGEVEFNAAPSKDDINYLIHDGFVSYGFYEVWYWGMKDLSTASARPYGWEGLAAGGLFGGFINAIPANGTFGWVCGTAKQSGPQGFGAVEKDKTFGPWTMPKGGMVGLAALGEGLLSELELNRLPLPLNSPYGRITQLSSIFINSGAAAAWVNSTYVDPKAP